MNIFFSQHDKILSSRRVVCVCENYQGDPGLKAGHVHTCGASPRGTCPGQPTGRQDGPPAGAPAPSGRVGISPAGRPVPRTSQAWSFAALEARRQAEVSVGTRAAGLSPRSPACGFCPRGPHRHLAIPEHPNLLTCPVPPPLSPEPPTPLSPLPAPPAHMLPGPGRHCRSGSRVAPIGQTAPSLPSRHASLKVMTLCFPG